AVVRPLLELGTREVVGALRPIDDKSYQALMERFYRAIGTGEAPSAALVEAQRGEASNTRLGEVAAWQYVQLFQYE
ncbi:MAG: CHAT domain-containing protein, partial [Pseudomonadota bacterium]